MWSFKDAFNTIGLEDLWEIGVVHGSEFDKFHVGNMAYYSLLMTLVRPQDTFLVHK